VLFQAYFLVQPINKVLAHLPSLSAQQNQDLPVAIAYPALGDFADPFSQLSPFLMVAFVAIRSTTYTQHSTGMPFAGSVLVAKIFDQRPAPIVPVGISQLGYGRRLTFAVAQKCRGRSRGVIFMA